MNLRALIATIRVHLNPWRAARETRHQYTRALLGNMTLAARNARLAARSELAERQRDTALAELDLLRPVVQAAVAWVTYVHAAPSPPNIWGDDHDFALIRAVDALPKVPTQRDGSDR